jgi:hypothetical protein
MAKMTFGMLNFNGSRTLAATEKPAQGKGA